MAIMSILLQEASLNKFVSLGTLVSGAVVFDMEVRIFVMDEAVWAFRKDKYKDLKIDTTVPGFEESLLKGIDTKVVNVWYDQLAELKEMGEVTINLCQLCCAIDNLEKDDFLDIVDRISSIATYIDDIFNADKVVCL